MVNTGEDLANVARIVLHTPEDNWEEALDSAIASLRAGDLEPWELELVRRRAKEKLEGVAPTVCVYWNEHSDNVGLSIPKKYVWVLKGAVSRRANAKILDSGARNFVDTLRDKLSEVV